MDKLWILCLFVSKKNIIIHIREQDYSHYSNSFPKKISFQKQKPISFPKKEAFVSSSPSRAYMYAQSIVAKPENIPLIPLISQ